jgi:hypothetical protein
MSKPTKWLILSACSIVIAAAAWYFVQAQRPMKSAVDVTAPEPAASASTSVPAIQHPLSGAVESAPVTDVDESDETIKSSLQQLFDTADLAEVLIPTQIIRHIVATVDNLPRAKLAVPSRPLHTTSGQFVIAGTADDRVIADANYARYARVVNLVRIADIAHVADWYRRHYSLFQQAYQGLGYPQGYFNDRLVQAIDDLLATPEPTAPIHLIQPKVFYEFADPSLESRSAGQKTLLRMGPYSVKLIKEKLRELRAAITKPLP